MRVPNNPNLPRNTDNLVERLTDVLRTYATQINLSSEGKIEGAYNALTAAPTTGTHAQGDFIRNSAPSELGSSPNKYVILGFLCVASGTPGTWVQCRCLTGN